MNVRDDGVVEIVGNGRLDYTTKLLEDPARVILKFSEVYLSDPIEVEVNRGNLIRARAGFHPEDGSTWVVLDMTEAEIPEITESGKTLEILPGKVTEKL